jgi:hypothetical protein
MNKGNIMEDLKKEPYKLAKLGKWVKYLEWDFRKEEYVAKKLFNSEHIIQVDSGNDDQNYTLVHFISGLTLSMPIKLQTTLSVLIGE